MATISQSGNGMTDWTQVCFLDSLEDLHSFESSLVTLISPFEYLFLGRIIRPDPCDPFIENILNPSENIGSSDSANLNEILLPIL